MKPIDRSYSHMIRVRVYSFTVDNTPLSCVLSIAPNEGLSRWRPSDTPPPRQPVSCRFRNLLMCFLMCSMSPMSVWFRKNVLTRKTTNRSYYEVKICSHFDTIYQTITEGHRVGHGLDWVRILRKLCGLDWIGSDDCNPLFFFHLYIFFINN